MNRLRWLFIGACFPWLAAGLCAFLISGYLVLRSQQEAEYGEGIVLWQTAHVTDWAAAYHPVEVYPHVVFHYTPLYHLASRAMALATGDLQMAGRLVSLLSTVGICSILAFVVWHCRPDGADRLARGIAAATAGLLIFTVHTWYWSALMRVDMLALLFSFSGIALFIFSRDRRVLAYAAFLFFVAAVYTKQSMIAAPLACFLLLVVEDPRSSLRVGAFALIAGLIPLAILQSVTNGLFWRNTFFYNQNPFTLTHLAGLWRVHLPSIVTVLCFALVLPALFLVRIEWRLGRLVRRLKNLLRLGLFGRALTVAAVFLGLALVGSIGSGKEGAWLNFFLEVDFAAILGCGLFIGWLFANGHGQRSPPRLALSLLVILLFVAHSFRNVPDWYRHTKELFHPSERHYSELIAFLKTAPGPVYSEDMTALMLAGREVPAEPAIITCLAKTGHWDESGFVRQLAGRHFSAVVVATDLSDRERFSANIARAIEQHYAVSRKIGPVKIYTPI